MQPKSSDSWYERHGVKPPEHIPHFSDEDLAKRMDEIRTGTKHGDWRQEGSKITCYRCPYNHSDSIPVDYLLMGTDKNGLPILKKIV